MRLLDRILNAEKWSRLPLAVEILCPDMISHSFHLNLPPQIQVRVKSIDSSLPQVTSSFILTKTQQHQSTSNKDSLSTSLNHLTFEQSCFCCHQKTTLILFRHSCGYQSHLICLARHFLHQEYHLTHWIPTSGFCPRCNDILSWGCVVGGW